MLKNRQASDNGVNAADEATINDSLINIEEIVAAADGMLYSIAQRKKVAVAPATRVELQDMTLCRIAEKMDDEVWDHMRQLSTMLASIRSGNITYIRAKVRIWRSLAPESIFDEDEQTCDEALLCSIIEDIEQLHAA